jgi:GNAT superfamily N-acetyltransferase
MPPAAILTPHARAQAYGSTMPVLPLLEIPPVDLSIGTPYRRLAGEIAARTRRALRGDLPSIVTLLDDVCDDDSYVRGAVGQVAALALGDFFLVLDRLDGGLAGAVHVRSDDDVGYARMVAVARDLRGHGLERRLVELARAMCIAAGCTRFDAELPSYLGDATP